jgi:hypothetical protein
MRSAKLICLVSGLSLVALGCTPTAEESGTDTDTDVDTDDTDDGMTPVHVTIGTHIEYQTVKECKAYANLRTNLLEMANLTDSYGAAWNLQVSGPFCDKVTECDDASLQADTNGKNLLQYLTEDFTKIRVDPHAHEDMENHTDIVVHLTELGVPLETITVVGGFETQNQDQFDSLDQGKAGTGDNSNVIWEPLVLTFAAVPGHNFPDESLSYSSGVHKPGGFDLYPSNGQDGDFYFEHTPENRMIVCGQGEPNSCAYSPGEGYFWQASDYVAQLVDFIETGEAPSGLLYTSTMATTSKQMGDFELYKDRYIDQLDELKLLVDEGKVVYVNYQDIPNLFVEYGELENQFALDNFTDHRTCEGGQEL